MGSARNMEKFIEVKDLCIYFRVKNKKVSVLKGVSFEINKGDRLAVIGESGSGKSTLVDAMVGILPNNSIIERGTLSFRGRSIQLNEKLNSKKGGSDFKFSIIFQDAKLSLNPSLKIIEQFKDYLLWHKLCEKSQVKEKTTQTLEKLGFEDIERVLESYPHQLSGGMAQRVAIAILALGSANLLIADEPTSALDILSGNDVVDTLLRLEDQTMMIITHDLGLAKKIANKILVLNKGKVSEFGAMEEVINNPKDPYTRSLVNSYKEKEALTTEKLKTENIIMKIKNVEKSYGDYSALENLNLQIYEGETFGILGASGSGKSTLSKIIMGIEEADRGEIEFQGIDLLGLKNKERKKFASDIQLIFQNARESLNPRYPVLELVQEVLINKRKHEKKEMEDLAKYYLKRVGLAQELYNKRPPELSTGQCQRVAIVRAIISSPKILICDEAISALDQNIQGEIIKLLIELKAELGITMIMITHDMRVLKGISDRIIVLRDGKNLGVYKIKELEALKDPYIKKIVSAE